MTTQKLKELYEQGHLTDVQYQHLELIISRKIVSVHDELQTLLYLGVLLFTSGMGILIYQNIGELGHILAISLLVIVMLVCMSYTHRKASPYSPLYTAPPTPYYDYISLLGCLLLISVQGYLQIQYGILNENLKWSTLFTALIFFLFAYRYDHRGVLSLAITAFASFWSLSLSPQQWYTGDFFETSNLYLTAMGFGAGLTGVALLLDRKNIKRHFTFIYITFGVLTFLTGALSGMFINNHSYALYLLALYIGCAFSAYFGRQNRSFLFLFYAFVFGYVGTTFFLTDSILQEPEVWFLYLLISCGLFIYFILRYRNFFKR